jgi:hypothetical protein
MDFGDLVEFGLDIAFEWSIGVLFDIIFYPIESDTFCCTSLKLSLRREPIVCRSGKSRNRETEAGTGL